RLSGARHCQRSSGPRRPAGAAGPCRRAGARSRHPDAGAVAGIGFHPHRGAAAHRSRRRAPRNPRKRTRRHARPGRLTRKSRPMFSMFYRLRYYLTDYRVLAVVGVVSAAALMFFGSDGLATIGIWVIALIVLIALIWAVVWMVRRVRGRRAAKKLDEMVEEDADRAVESARPAARADTEALRERMLEAVKAIKSSRIGVLKGKAALYELPWYVIIGNPAAGKSSAILNSGLKFPFEDNRSNVIQGIGGTRNCDWYFTTE